MLLFSQQQCYREPRSCHAYPMTYLHVDSQTHLGISPWKIWVLLGEWAIELLQYSFYRARLNMSWMAISMERKDRQNSKSVKILLSKLSSPFLLPWSSHPGGELVFLSLQKQLGMCSARLEQSSSQHRQAASYLRAQLNSVETETKNERLIFWFQSPSGRLEIIFGRVKKSFQDRTQSQAFLKWLAVLGNSAVMCPAWERGIWMLTLWEALFRAGRS